MCCRMSEFRKQFKSRKRERLKSQNQNTAFRVFAIVVSYPPSGSVLFAHKLISQSIIGEAQFRGVPFERLPAEPNGNIAEQDCLGKSAGVIEIGTGFWPAFDGFDPFVFHALIEVL